MTIKVSVNVLRIFLCFVMTIYIYNGINKIINFNNTIELLSSKITFLNKFAKIATIITIIIETLLPIIIIFFPSNNILSQLSIIILSLYMCVVTFYYHNPITNPDQLNNFINRLSMIGSLLVLLYVTQ